MNSQARIYLYLLLSLTVPLIVFMVLHMNPAWDYHLHSPNGHFYVVSIVSGLAFALAIAVGVAAIRLRNLKISFLSLSFVSLAALFLVHGLSTPREAYHTTALPSNAAQMSILLAVMWLWLSSMSSDRRIISWLSTHQRWLLPIWTASIAVICALLWLFSDQMSWLQMKQGPIKWTATLLIIGLNGWTMYRYLETYLSTRFPLQLAIVYSSGWMIAAQFINVMGKMWMLSWWIYHLLLLASISAMIIGIYYQYRSSGSYTMSLKQLFQNDPKEWIHTYMSPAVRELIRTTETRDAYTAGHNYRVALYAIQLGEELGLNSDQLRAIAQGGIVHDIGKLIVPDNILNKPGKLTPEERDIIEKHPVTGFNLCRRLGFMQEELAVIRSHHERWDGSGYPDALSGDNIPLLARVTAVADVYDALTSSRSYRAALSHEEAMTIILKERGKHFDPLCVDALVRIAGEKGWAFKASAS
ncbi:HD-GYP domain-containing protein [Paenibacillus sp. JDR-2]|uniref:HD-GYP domain-containing protein n=1 Tax=Paenibacillus sp. (strain JDR-2) TaxID=324057 RepID=UPI000166B2BB|nr:HD domain-containing phosphohydrolase [Paenibacillus sp. JDR-2]ACS99126.1 metal dependent phosphohydrolase [Paenibacillus sp. JDR-2]